MVYMMISMIILPEAGKPYDEPEEIVKRVVRRLDENQRDTGYVGMLGRCTPLKDYSHDFVATELLPLLVQAGVIVQRNEHRFDRWMFRLDTARVH
jgi:hypothetical protein